MTKITFEDLPSTNTPLSASNLNTMQDNIEDAINNVEITLDSTVSTSSTNGVENQAITNYVNGLILNLEDISNLFTLNDSTNFEISAKTVLKYGKVVNIYLEVVAKNQLTSGTSYDILLINSSAYGTTNKVLNSLVQYTYVPQTISGICFVRAASDTLRVRFGSNVASNASITIWGTYLID